MYIRLYIKIIRNFGSSDLSDRIGSDPVRSDPRNPTFRSDPCTSLVEPNGRQRLVNGATLFSLVYAIFHGPDEYSAQHGTTTDIPVELITTTDNSSVSSTQLLFSRWCQRSQSRQRSAVDDVSGLFVETINYHNKLTNDNDR